MPFLVEDSLKEAGGIYSKGLDWASHVRVDATLVTGQNPAYSKEVAEALLKLLQARTGPGRVTDCGPQGEE